MGNAIREVPPLLPEKFEDWKRSITTDRTLNDLVEELHKKAWEDPYYRRLLNAVYDEQAIEGSLSADNVFAATFLRDLAKKTHNEVADEKVATIIKALNVVLRRYNASRVERRNTVQGKIVPTNNGNE